MKKIEFFKIENNRINRIRKYCPKCGPGIFLAEHKNRFSCGSCGYTEFKGGGRSTRPATVEEKPVEKIEAPTLEEEKLLDEPPKEEEISESKPKQEKTTDEDKEQ